MAYNNNSYGGFNRGYSGGGQSRPPQRLGLDPFEGTLFLLPLPFCPNRFIFSEFKIYFH